MQIFIANMRHCGALFNNRNEKISANFQGGKKRHVFVQYAEVIRDICEG